MPLGPIIPKVGSSLPTPVSIANGGTGATTAAAALTALGGISKITAVTSLGDGTGDKATSSQTMVAMGGIAAASIAAAAGDVLLVSFVASVYMGVAAARGDICIGIASTAKTDVIARCSIASINTVEPLPLTRLYTVQAGDISGGNVSVAPYWRTPDAGNALNVGNSAGIVPVLTVANLGH